LLRACLINRVKKEGYDMKKSKLLAIVIVFMLAALAGCKKPEGARQPESTEPPVSAPQETAGPSAEPSPPQETASPSPSADQEAILSEFESLLESGADEKEAIDMMLEKLPVLSKSNASKMVLMFEQYQLDAVARGDIVNRELVDLIQSSLEEPYNEEVINDPAAIEDDAMKNAIQHLLDRGYKLITPEGMYEAVINYGAYKKFENYVTPDIRAYIEVKASESEKRTLSDAAIIIPIDEVYRRATSCMRFIELYPDSSKLEDVKSMYSSYIDSYFYGRDNTPAFGYSGNKLEQDFLDSYKAAAEDVSNPAWSAALQDYLAVLEENGCALTQAVKDQRENLVNRLKAL
jgi:hypothetical protein